MPLIQAWVEIPTTDSNFHENNILPKDGRFNLQIIGGFDGKSSPQFSLHNTYRAIETNNFTKQTSNGGYVYVLEVDMKTYNALYKNWTQNNEENHEFMEGGFGKGYKLPQKSISKSIHLNPKSYSVVGAIKASGQYGYSKVGKEFLMINPEASKASIEEFARQAHEVYNSEVSRTIETGMSEEAFEHMRNPRLPVYRINSRGTLSPAEMASIQASMSKIRARFEQAKEKRALEKELEEFSRKCKAYNKLLDLMNRIPNVRNERELNRLYQKYCQTYMNLSSDSAVKKAGLNAQKTLKEMDPCKIADISERRIQKELPDLCGRRGKKQKKAIQQELVGAIFNEDTSEIAFDSGKNLQIFDENFEFSNLSGNPVTLIDTDGAGLTSREAVYYDPSASEQNNKFEKLYHSLVSREKNVDTEQKLEKIQRKLGQCFRSDDVKSLTEQWKVDHPESVLKSTNDKETPLVPLEKFIQSGQGKCRHHSFANAVLLGRLVQNKILPKGQVRHFKGTAYNGSAHTWVIYSTGSHLYLLDSTLKNKQVFDLNNVKDKQRAIDSYCSRGLNGVLDDMLEKLELMEINRPLAAELIDGALNPAVELTEEEEQNYLCPISMQIIADPVGFKTTAGNIIYYDKKSIETWLRSHNTDPMTRQPVTLASYLPSSEKKEEIRAFLESKQPETTEDKTQSDLTSSEDEALYKLKYEALANKINAISQSSYAGRCARFFRTAHKSRFESLDALKETIKGFNESESLSYQKRYEHLRQEIEFQKNATKADHDGIGKSKGRKMLQGNKSRLVQFYDDALDAANFIRIESGINIYNNN
ncbi:hypothetical protein E3983_05225 [Legionella israelensis]|uniref:U-box domain-containing protein n=1 Tax=Legionella israelensis TaxID=454 RepID=A0AAX1EG00_9GAMM|nr:U-box domain-containing protein [Legionella israelensis]QBR83802.1 hypothetical protein E3983_05225 [Legionella israelensis]